MNVEKYYLPEDDQMPNNPDLPVLIYRGVSTDESDAASFFEHVFGNNGWGGSWRNGIFDYHHFHSNAHEVLGIAEGQVSVKLGGDNGALFHLVKGDCVILPAGTGHKRMDATQDLLVVGAYPKGQENYDVCRDWQNSLGIKETIRTVLWPDTNPLQGIVPPDGHFNRL